MYWFMYSLCVYVQQCLGEESVLNLKNFSQQLLIMKLVQNKPTKPNDNVSLPVVHFVMTMYHLVTSSCPFCNYPVAVDHDLKKFSCPNPDCEKVS